jgi:hypothetical protein
MLIHLMPSKALVGLWFPRDWEVMILEPLVKVLLGTLKTADLEKVPRGLEMPSSEPSGCMGNQDSLVNLVCYLMSTQSLKMQMNQHQNERMVVFLEFQF